MKPEQAKALREPFPPEQIGTIPKGGVQLSYVGHAAVTDRLLQVDPEWTWEPYGLDERGRPILEENVGGMQGETYGLWIRLNVCGVTRPGFGGGKNAKECISDAIRNAAMRFGVALDLWAKEDLHGDTAGEKKSSYADKIPPKAKPPVGLTAAEQERCDTLVAKLLADKLITQGQVDEVKRTNTPAEFLAKLERFAAKLEKAA